jgi:hypothetical protein
MNKRQKGEVNILLLFFLVIGIALLSSGLFYYNKKHRLPRKKTPIQLAKSADSLPSCIDALKNNCYMEVFAPHINQNIQQIERFNKKRATINDMLLQKFTASEISYQKFDTVLTGVEQVVYINVRSILNKIAAFDYEEYQQLDNLEWNKDGLAREKMDIYQTYIHFVDEATRDNEEIILRVDKLLLEVSEFNMHQDVDIMNMPAMAELDKLIKNAKLYR